MKEKEMRPIIARWLQDKGFGVAHEILISGYCDLAGFRFAQRTSRRIPKLLSVITVELKINNVLDVIKQARGNKHFVNASYAAMPLDKCERMRLKTIRRFRQEGIGLLGVSGKVKVIVKPKYEGNKNIKWMTSKMWRWQRKGEAGTEDEPKQYLQLSARMTSKGGE